MHKKTPTMTSKASFWLCLVVLLLTVFGNTACESVDRYIVTQNWHDSETLQISYTERKHKTMFIFKYTVYEEGRLMMCRLQPDNSLECKDQQEVNALLNAQ